MTDTIKQYDLEKRTLDFAKKTISLCRSIGKDIVNKELIGQLVRSAGSVGANYREANESLSKKDFVYRIKICRKEAKESSYWFELLKEGNENRLDEIFSLFNESLELKKIFSAIAEKSE